MKAVRRMPSGACRALACGLCMVVATPLPNNAAAAVEGPAAGTQPRDPRLDAARAELQQWADSIVNVRVKYESRESREEEGGVTEYVVLTDFCLTDSGQLRYYAVTTAGDETLHRTLMLFDADRTYSARYRDGPSDYNRPETVGIGPPRELFPIVIQPLFGVWIEVRLAWLSTVLADPKAHLTQSLGTDALLADGDLECAIPTTPEGTMTVLLDAQHGFLPKLAVSGSARSEVEEFRRVDPLGLWFPWSGTFTIKHPEGYPSTSGSRVHRWRVQSLALNDAIPESFFRPPIGVGTIVADALEQTTYTHGDGGPRRPLEDAIARSADENLGNPGELRAYLQHPVNWTLWISAGLVALSIVLLVAACISRARQRAPRRQ